MVASVEPPKSQAAISGSDLPPLRVAHVLLYLAVASAFLVGSMSAWLNPAEDLRSASDETYRRIIATPPALWNAATTTVLILLVIWTIQRRRVWRLPGHWLALWLMWSIVSIYFARQMLQVVRVLAGVGLKDDWAHFWGWAKSVYALQFLPFGVLFVCFALGWRRVANTWPWRIYFGVVGVWLLLVPTAANLPFDWGNTVDSLIPISFRYWILYRLKDWSDGLLLLALVNDLLPGRERRHWSHWVPAVQPLLAFGFWYAPPIVWDFLQHERLPFPNFTT